MLRAISAALCVATLIGVFAPAANALAIKYEATCVDNLFGQSFRQCASVGLTEGDLITATFILNTDTLPLTDPFGLSLSRADVLSWSANFGTASFGSADTDNWDFFINFNASGQINQFGFLAASEPSPDLGFVLDLQLVNAFGGTGGRCEDSNGPVACQLFAGQFFLATDQAAGPVASIQVVPIPAAGLLFLSALGALGWTQRSRHQG